MGTATKPLFTCIEGVGHDVPLENENTTKSLMHSVRGWRLAGGSQTCMHSVAPSPFVLGPHG